MPDFATKPLTKETWPEFAHLVEQHGGIFGGCWCMGFHAKGKGWGVSAAQNRLDKEALVHSGQAHAALVYAGNECVGWCQFGSPQELPRIKNRRAYMEGAAPLPDWRITCFFSGKGHRSKGVAAAALEGAIVEIAKHGGGTVEGYPEDNEGRATSGSFLFNGSLSMFERQGFVRQRLIGKRKWVVVRVIDSAP